MTDQSRVLAASDMPEATIDQDDIFQKKIMLNNPSSVSNIQNIV